MKIVSGGIAGEANVVMIATMMKNADTDPDVAMGEESKMKLIQNGTTK